MGGNGEVGAGGVGVGVGFHVTISGWGGCVGWICGGCWEVSDCRSAEGAV